MKATKIIQLLAIALALTIVGTGCQKRPTGITPLKDRQTRLGDPGLGGTYDPNLGGVLADPGFGTAQDPKQFIKDGNYNVNSSALAAHVVHFDYDSSVVKSSEQSHVRAVADYLKSNSSVGLRVDGHCDERGTEDYNNSLGERRALALRDAVIALGVEADRVITQTFGENKPVAFGQDESAYRQNRRGEFMVLEPK
jgi:peptidoglycan-associated lipoprotein